jgi:hypothetical protein
MAQVAPALADDTEDAAFVQVVPDKGMERYMYLSIPLSAGARSTDRSARRLGTRFKQLSGTERQLAFALRALSQPRTRYSLLATLVVCTLLMLLVGVPYALNERMADANPMLQTATRGLIVGIWACFMLGPMFLVNAPIIVRGGFHP